MKTISVIKAEYLDKYKIKITFNDNTLRVIDFLPFLNDNPHPQWEKYKNLTNFRKYKIENGNLVWGSNWDIVFPIANLYNDKLTESCC